MIPKPKSMSSLDDVTTEYEYKLNMLVIITQSETDVVKLDYNWDET